ncbi:hypothetical protein FHS85_000453 [Rhodoligotrophos appendicifer]|uniref:hypothetical protein n=1 Tax=Rhodoligotrophos appendicifer TaxID=987056 RepID=UPI00117BF541|nr:hypothetical protein [Rhodoligotrophos appendicifer]
MTRRWKANRLSAAKALGLAASPTFAVMALLTAMLPSGSSQVICSIEEASMAHGMVIMYLLMTAFHASPWLTMIHGEGARRPISEHKP